MQLFALLGAHPDISIAEITALTNHSPSWREGQLAIFDEFTGNPKLLGQRLGGTQKLGVVVGSLKSLEKREVADFLAQDLTTEHPEGKIHFGLSVYGADTNKVGIAREQLKNAGMELKSVLKEAGRSARYVISKDATLSAVVITSNHLLTKGAEYAFIVNGDDIIVARTVAVQNVDEWAHRDLNRPRRNAKQGMLPPKLARMLVNLAGLETSGKSLYDPFCGSGTILSEGAVIGYSQLVGSDINAQAAADTQTNLEWLSEQGVSVPPSIVFTSAAALAPKNEALAKVKVDAIVTETYLGRPRKGDEELNEVQEAINYVARLYEESFAALKDVLKPNGTVVIASPVHIVDGESLAVPVDEIMTSLGYTAVPLFNEELIYRQETQYVGRKISKFILS